MNVDLITRKNIFIAVSISLWLPQLLITDALQVGNISSCDDGYDVPSENTTFSIAPIPAVLVTFSPYEPLTYDLRDARLRLNKSSTPKSTPSTTILLTPSPPSIATAKFEPTSTRKSFPIQTTSSVPLPLDLLSPSINSSSAGKDDTLSSTLSSSMIYDHTPSWLPMPSSNVQSTPIIELASHSKHLVSSLNPSPASSPVPSLVVNDTDSFHASHTVTPGIPVNHHGHQPSGSQINYRVANETATPSIDDWSVTSMNSNNHENGTVNSKDLSEIINETPISHNLSPTSTSSFFPALSGTISYLPSSDLPTTDSTFSWPPIDNIYYNNNNQTNDNNNNHHEENSENHHGIPEAATSNKTKCDPRENQFTQPAPDSGFLVRSVLKRFDDESPLSLDNLTTIFETRLANIFNLAYRNQLTGLKVSPNGINKDIHVKLWNLFWNNSTDHFHLIYQTEQDNHKLLAQDLQAILSHISPEEMSNILGYNGTIKAEPYVNTLERKNNNLASALENLEWLPLMMIFLSVIVFIFCSLLTLIAWKKNRKLRSSSPHSSSIRTFGDHSELGNGHLKTKSSISKPTPVAGKLTTKESLVNWRKVSAPGSKRSFLGSHGGSGMGLNISGGCSAASGTIDSNHEFEYLAFDSPTSSLNLRTAEYRPRRPYSSFPNQSRLELTKEKVIPIGELDEIAEISSNSSHDAHHHPHRHPSSRKTYVTTKEEMVGVYENPLMRSGGVGGGVDEVDCSVPQLIQVHISEQTQNIIQAIRSELKKFNPITGTSNVQSQSQSSQLKESTSTSDA